jgi:effector-binding domain-containing protein
MKIRWSAACGLILLNLILNQEFAMAVEEPRFKVELKKEAYEVRLYEPVLVAETRVNTDFEQAGNSAFRILADYIFGNNLSKSKIAMTAPVSQSSSEKIAMTAPVNLSKDKDSYLVQFTMPEKYTLDTLPKPIDERVSIRQIPARKVAVFRYSGSWSESRYNEKLQIFTKELEKDNMKTKGEPVFARFNSPFSLWFLRRNEIWIDLVND